MTSSFCLCLCAFLCLCYCICLYFCSVEHHRRCNSPWAHSFTETYYSLLTQLAIILHISTKGLEVEEGRHFPILGFWLPLLLQTSLYREVSASSSVCWLERNWEKLPSLNFSPPPPPPNLIAHSHLFSSLTWQFIASIVSHNIFMFAENMKTIGWTIFSLYWSYYRVCEWPNFLKGKKMFLCPFHENDWIESDGYASFILPQVISSSKSKELVVNVKLYLLFGNFANLVDPLKTL